MFGLIFDIGRWAFRRAFWFISIAFILWVGMLLKQQLTELAAMADSAKFLYQHEQGLREQVAVLEHHSEESANRLKRASVGEIDKRIRALKEESESKKARLRGLDSIIGKLSPSTLIDSTSLKVEIELAAQEIAFLQDVRALSEGIPKQKTRCDFILNSHRAAFREHGILNSQLNALDGSMSLIDQINPLSSTSRQRAALLERMNDVAQTTFRLRDDYPRCTRLLADMEKRIAQIGNFKVNGIKNSEALNALKKESQLLSEKASSHPLQVILVEPLVKVAPVALWIVVGLVAVPVCLKAFFYFVLAPIAARRRPIRLSVEALGNVSANSPASSVSVKLTLRPEEELLVLSEYLQADTVACRIAAKLWLPGCGFVTSYAAGMRNLSEVRCSKETTVTVSAGSDTLNELAIIDVPFGEALCLRPSHLVGIIHQSGHPIKISRHWRLTNLQAWLTLQVRYVVFHGSLRLVVKGCRGVVVRDATDEGSISQQLTMGFSANLDYGTRRTETFFAYLFGKKELLRDHFSGSRGIYLFEEISHPSKRSGVSGKGFEGLADAAMKVFGI